MQLKIVSTGSIGNAYILENEDEALLLEFGVHFKKIKESLRFNLKKVVGGLVTHRHGDHAKGLKDACNAGIDVFCLKDVSDYWCKDHHRITNIEAGSSLKLGNFQIRAFKLEHDVPSVGFLINHPETGRFCFITDTMYCKYQFEGLNNIIIEANYCETILQSRLDAGEEPKFLNDRVIQSHMSLQTCKQFLLNNSIKSVMNIVVIHLSDRNSDAKRFRQEIRDITAKRVTIAEKGQVIEFNKSIF